MAGPLMTSWRIEEKFVSRMGDAHWLVVSGGYQSRGDAMLALSRLNARAPEKRASRGKAIWKPERRIVELPE
jgi:hypothetical protein